VLAHHSYAPYDDTKTVELEGTLVEVAWRNPPWSEAVKGMLRVAQLPALVVARGRVADEITAWTAMLRASHDSNGDRGFPLPVATYLAQRSVELSRAPRIPGLPRSAQPSGLSRCATLAGNRSWSSHAINPA
jgi:hypothetical protein